MNRRDSHRSVFWLAVAILFVHAVLVAAIAATAIVVTQRLQVISITLPEKPKPAKTSLELRRLDPALVNPGYDTTPARRSLSQAARRERGMC